MKNTDKQQILKYLIELFEEYADSDIPEKKVTIASPIKEMEMDSVDLIKIILSIEEEFDIEFNDEELLLESIRSIEDMADFIVEKIK